MARKKKTVILRDELRQLVDQPIARRVKQAINHHAETGHGDVIPLRGREAEWRLRVGQWRALLTFDEANEGNYLLYLPAV